MLGLLGQDQADTIWWREVANMTDENVPGVPNKLDEKIKSLDKRIEQLERQKQSIANREKERERKHRARRLIQNGALAERYLRCEGITPEAFENRLKKLVELSGVTDFLKSDK